MTTVVVAGALANKAGSGGEAWVRLSWIRGLQRLGLDVWFVEQLADDDPAAIAYFERVIAESGLTQQSALLVANESRCGPALATISDVASGATLLNISGHLDHPALFPRFRRRVLVDIDPGYTQVWHLAGDPGARVSGHDLYVTIAERIGQPDCPIPTCGLEWITVRQPVVLDDWPLMPPPTTDRFTTVASWRGAFGPVTVDGTAFGVKAHEFRKFLTLPEKVRHRFEIALSIAPWDESDRAALERSGWRLVDPRRVACDPAAFQCYVQGSSAEFSVAQGVYVHTNSGWFSDRTVRYLASGRPALVQDTGFGERMTTGLGLVPFRTLDEATAGAADIVARYDEHATAARAIATAYFDSDIVLARLCEQCGIG